MFTNSSQRRVKFLKNYTTRKDKKWYEKYLLPFMKIGDEVIALFSVDYKLVLPEFKDIDPVEMEELKAWAIEEFDIPNDKVEAKLESGFELMFEF